MPKSRKEEEPKTVSWEEVRCQIEQDLADFTIVAEVSDGLGTPHKFAVSFGADGRVHDFQTITDDSSVLYCRRPTLLIGENEGVPATGFYHYGGPCIMLAPDDSVTDDLYYTSIQKLITGDDTGTTNIGGNEYNTVYMTGVEYKAVLSDAIRRMDDLMPNLTEADMEDRRKAKEYEDDVCMYLTRAVANYQEALTVEHRKNELSAEECHKYTGRRAEVAEIIMTDDHFVDGKPGANHRDQMYVIRTANAALTLFDKYADAEIIKANDVMNNSQESVIAHNAAAEAKMVAERRKEYDKRWNSLLGGDDDVSAMKLGIMDEMGRGSFAGLMEMQKTHKELDGVLQEAIKPAADNIRLVNDALESVGITGSALTFNRDFSIAKDSMEAAGKCDAIKDAISQARQDQTAESWIAVQTAIEGQGGRCQVGAVFEDLNKVETAIKALGYETPDSYFTDDMKLAGGWMPMFRVYAGITGAEQTQDPDVRVKALADLNHDSAFGTLDKQLDAVEGCMHTLGFAIPAQRLNDDFTLTDEWKDLLHKRDVVQPALQAFMDCSDKEHLDALVDAIKSVDPNVMSLDKLQSGEAIPFSMRLSSEYDAYIESKLDELIAPPDEKSEAITALFDVRFDDATMADSSKYQVTVDTIERARQFLLDMPDDIYSIKQSSECAFLQEGHKLMGMTQSTEAILKSAAEAAEAQQTIQESVIADFNPRTMKADAETAAAGLRAFDAITMSSGEMADDHMSRYDDIRTTVRQIRAINTLEMLHPALMDKDTFRSVRHDIYNSVCDLDECGRGFDRMLSGYVGDKSLEDSLFIAYAAANDIGDKQSNEFKMQHLLEQEQEFHHNVKFPDDSDVKYGTLTARQYFERMQVRSAVVSLLEQGKHGVSFEEKVNAAVESDPRHDRIKIATDLMREDLREYAHNSLPEKFWSDQVVMSYLSSVEFTEIAKKPTMLFDPQNNEFKPRPQFAFDWNDVNHDLLIDGALFTEPMMRDMRTEIQTLQNEFRKKNGYPSQELKEQDMFLLDILSNNAVSKRIGYETIIHKGMDSVVSLGNLTVEEAIRRQAIVTASFNYASLGPRAGLYGMPSEPLELTERELRIYNNEIERLEKCYDRFKNWVMNEESYNHISQAIDIDVPYRSNMKLSDLNIDLTHIDALNKIRDAMLPYTTDITTTPVDTLFHDVWQVRMEYVDENMRTLVSDRENLSQLQYELAFGACKNIATEISLRSGYAVSEENLMRQVQMSATVNQVLITEDSVRDGTIGAVTSKPQVDTTDISAG